MEDTCIFRQPDLKINDLAEKLGISSNLLSYYFNQYLNSNYYRFLNSYRIKYFKKLVAEGNSKTYTLTAISRMCGFSSRTSFFRHFKAAEGTTPSDYIKNLEENR